jgi:hypothetical protein
MPELSDGLCNEIFEYGSKEENKLNTRSDVVKHAYQDDT